MGMFSMISSAALDSGRLISFFDFDRAAGSFHTTSVAVVLHGLDLAAPQPCRLAAPRAGQKKQPDNLTVGSDALIARRFPYPLDLLVIQDVVAHLLGRLHPCHALDDRAAERIVSSLEPSQRSRQDGQCHVGGGWPSAGLDLVEHCDDLGALQLHDLPLAQVRQDVPVEIL